MSTPRTFHLSGGKYTIQNDSGRLTATRNGEAWPAGDAALLGDKLSLALVHTLEQLEDKLHRLHALIVCAPIADPSEICSTAFDILEEPLQ